MSVIAKNKRVMFNFQQVWAVNGAGQGAPSNITHCFSLQTPQISCQKISDTKIFTGVSVGKTEADGYLYSVHITYHDIDGVEVPTVIPLNGSTSLNHTCELYLRMKHCVQYERTYRSDMQMSAYLSQENCIIPTKIS